MSDERTEVERLRDELKGTYREISLLKAQLEKTAIIIQDGHVTFRQEVGYLALDGGSAYFQGGAW